MSIDRSSATLTTRYRKDQMDVYEGVMDLVREHTPNLSKSMAQFLLVEKGLKHLDNPTPLKIPKPKVVVKKEVVYKDKPVEKIVEKIVYKDKPLPAHIQRIIDETAKQAQRTKDRATPKEHLEAEEVYRKDEPEATQATQQETPTSTGSGWLWLIAGIVGLCGWKIGSLYYGQKNGNIAPTQILNGHTQTTPNWLV